MAQATAVPAIEPPSTANERVSSQRMLTPSSAECRAPVLTERDTSSVFARSAAATPQVNRFV